MPKAALFNMAGERVGEVELSEAVFGIEPNETALFESVKQHLANKRQGTQSTLTNAEVSGGGIKPYRQKGTGRARQGSIRNIHYVHGGVAFAPKPRSYSYTLNKKTRRLALKSALSQKAAESSVIVVDNLDMNEIKTADFKRFLDAVGFSGKALVVTPEPREKVIKSARNIPGVTTTTATIISPYEVLNNKKFIVDKAALAKIEEVFA